MENYLNFINQIIVLIDFLIVSVVVFKTHSFSPLAISLISSLTVTLLIEVYFKSLNNGFTGIFSSMAGEKTLALFLKLLV